MGTINTFLGLVLVSFSTENKQNLSPSLTIVYKIYELASHAVLFFFFLTKIIFLDEQPAAISRRKMYRLLIFRKSDLFTILSNNLNGNSR